MISYVYNISSRFGFISGWRCSCKTYTSVWGCGKIEQIIGIVWWIYHFDQRCF